MSNRVNVDQLSSGLETAAVEAGFTVSVYGRAAGYPLLGLKRLAQSRHETSRSIYLSAGIHGDEPAGPLALLDLLRSDALPRHHDFYICPLMNPTGLAAGTRENAEGLDLNRGYTDFAATEICSHRDWLHANLRQLDLSVHLHEDWETQGFYLYELNFGKLAGHADAILRAVTRFLPIESAEMIDGRPIKAGVIRPESIPEIPEGLPESLHLQELYGGLNYTVETPSALEQPLRVAALKAAVLAVV